MNNDIEFFQLHGNTTLFRVVKRGTMGGFIQVVTGHTIDDAKQTTARIADVNFLTRAEAYEIAIERKHQLEAIESECSKLLKSIPGVGSVISKGVKNGLTPDHVKATPQYKSAKKQLDSAFKALREYNGGFCKLFAHEYQAERRAKESSK